MPRDVISFLNGPSPQYVSVNNLTFPSVDLLRGMYQLPPSSMVFPNAYVDKNREIPQMNVQTIYNYERNGIIQG